MTQTTIPSWNGKPITPGWWWLQFTDGLGPRHWDGTFWDRGSIFVTAEDYADYPVVGPCIPPDSLVEPSEAMIDAGLHSTNAHLTIPGSGLTVAREKMRIRFRAMIRKWLDENGVSNEPTT